MAFWSTKNSADEVEVDFVVGEGSLFNTFESQQSGNRLGTSKSGIYSSQKRALFTPITGSEVGTVD